MEASALNEESDEELMADYILGNKTAFQNLYARYQRRLKGFLRRRLRSNQLHFMEDLFQVTWLKTHQARSGFDRSQKFSSWFFTIALNTLRDFLSESRHRFEIQTDNIAMANITSGRNENLVYDLKNLETLLQQLPRLQRKIILLSDWEGFNSKEIAAMYQTSDGAIRQIISRTRKQLKDWMEGSIDYDQKNK